MDSANGRSAAVQSPKTPIFQNKGLKIWRIPPQFWLLTAVSWNKRRVRNGSDLYCIIIMKESVICILLLLTGPVMMQSCASCYPFCANSCPCPNDGFYCTSNCCYDDVCRDMDVCNGTLAGWAIALIVVAVLFGIFIFIMCLACCCGICSCILCCCRQSIEERRRSRRSKVTTHVVYTQHQSPPPQMYQPSYPPQSNQQFV